MLKRNKTGVHDKSIHFQHKIEKLRRNREINKLEQVVMLS